MILILDHYLKNSKCLLKNKLNLKSIKNTYSQNYFFRILILFK